MGVRCVLNPYRSRQWANFKNEVIEIDGGKCTSCSRSKAHGAVLQVHHRQYISDRMPWEYPHELCFTLCSRCHAAEHGIIPPNFGWSYAGWEDLGSLIGTCDCCGTAIRYSFLIDHPNWFPLEVGTVCCDNLTSEQVASGVMDSQRRYRARLKTFSKSKRWHSLTEDIHNIRYKNCFIQVLKESDGFRLRIDQINGKLRFDDLDSAKAAVFRGIEDGSIRKYVSKHSKRT
jgi:RNase P subunit RPR2